MDTVYVRESPQPQQPNIVQYLQIKYLNPFVSTVVSQDCDVISIFLLCYAKLGMMYFH